MIDEDVEFIDADTDFRANKANTFKDIVMNHLAKISTICTKEFKEGYWENRPVATAGGVYMSQVYKEDTRDAYTNSIDFLHDLMLPKFDNEAKFSIDIINNDLESKKPNIKDKNEWRDEKLLARRLIFQQLSLLLKRLDYLESGAIED